MRRWLALLVLLLVPTSAGHADHDPLAPGDFLNHVQVWQERLPGNASAQQTLAFSGFPLKAGWDWLAQVETDGNLSLRLHYDTVEEAAEPDTWTVGPGVSHLLARIPTDGLPTLNVTNLDPADTTFTLYYDQTCECRAKIVPTPSGPLWFNQEARKGDTIDYEVLVQPTLDVPATEDPPLPRHINITVEIGRMAEGDVFIVDETRSFAFRPDTDPGCRSAARWNGCFDFSYPAQQDGRNQVRMWIEVDDPAWRAVIGPQITAQPAAGNDAPAMPLALLLVALVAVGYRRA